jgi:hypothetical protein
VGTPVTLSARERVGWALLFGVPMGVGISLATSRMAGSGMGDPLVVAAGTTAAVVLVAFVLLATGVNQEGSA